MVVDWSDDVQWRIIIGIGALPAAVLLVVSLIFVKESSFFVDKETDNSYPFEKASVEEKGKCYVVKYVVLGFFLAACLQLTGINAIMFFGVNILSTIETFANDKALLLTANLVYNRTRLILGYWSVEHNIYTCSCCFSRTCRKKNTIFDRYSNVVKCPHCNWNRVRVLCK